MCVIFAPAEKSFLFARVNYGVRRQRGGDDARVTKTRGNGGEVLGFVYKRGSFFFFF